MSESLENVDAKQENIERLDLNRFLYEQMAEQKFQEYAERFDLNKRCVDDISFEFARNLFKGAYMQGRSDENKAQTIMLEQIIKRKEKNG